MGGFMGTEVVSLVCKIPPAPKHISLPTTTNYTDAPLDKTRLDLHSAQSYIRHVHDAGDHTHTHIHTEELYNILKGVKPHWT